MGFNYLLVYTHAGGQLSSESSGHANHGQPAVDQLGEGPIELEDGNRGLVTSLRAPLLLRAEELGGGGLLKHQKTLIVLGVDILLGVGLSKETWISRVARCGNQVQGNMMLILVYRGRTLQLVIESKLGGHCLRVLLILSQPSIEIILLLLLADRVREVPI